MRNHFDAMVKGKLALRKESVYGSRTIVVSKPGGGWRVVGDYRLTNKEIK
jgi:hypothetical protein